MTDDQTLRRNLRNFFDRSSPGQLSILCHELAEAFLRKHYSGSLDLSRIAFELELLQSARDTVRAAAEASATGWLDAAEHERAQD